MTADKSQNASNGTGLKWSPTQATPLGHQRSLTAPSRSLAIPLDDGLDGNEAPSGSGASNIPELSLSSSDSDSDENHQVSNNSKGTCKKHRKPLPKRLKRSRSDLSLESCLSNPDKVVKDARAGGHSGRPLRARATSQDTVQPLSLKNGSQNFDTTQLKEPVPDIQPRSEFSGTLTCKIASCGDGNAKSSPLATLSSFQAEGAPDAIKLVPKHSENTTTPHLRVAASSSRSPAKTNINTTIGVNLPSEPGTLSVPHSAPCSASSPSNVNTYGTGSMKTTPTTPVCSALQHAPSIPRESTSEDVEVVSVRVVKPLSRQLGGQNSLTSRLVPRASRLSSGLTEPSLVSIAPLVSSHFAGWDRFIFFSHRIQRFSISLPICLSTLSPFSAVTSGMNGLRPDSVCAVCGAGGSLCKCPRCTLGFHFVCMGRSASYCSIPFCAACGAANINERTTSWELKAAPPALPPPESGLPRLIVDAQQGNPIDYVLNPSLFNSYVKDVGADWLRCVDCKQVRTVCEGPLSEAVCIPFNCSQAFWEPEHLRKCNVAISKYATKQQEVQENLKKRSRLRTLLRYFMLGEEDRTDYDSVDAVDETKMDKPRDIPVVSAHRSSSSSSTGNERMQSGTAVENMRPCDIANTALDRFPGLGESHKTPAPAPKDSATFEQSQAPKLSADSDLLTLDAAENRIALPEQSHNQKLNDDIVVSASAVAHSNGLVSTRDSTVLVPDSCNPENANDLPLQLRLLRDIERWNFDPWVEDLLTELALAKNDQILNLYLALGQNERTSNRFKRQATLLASRVRGSISMMGNSVGKPDASGITTPTVAPSNTNSFNGLNTASYLSPLVAFQMRSDGGGLREFRLHQLRTELEACSNAVNQLVSAPSNQVVSAHIQTYSQIAALRSKQEEELQRFVRELANTQLLHQTEQTTLQRRPIQALQQLPLQTAQHISQIRRVSVPTQRISSNNPPHYQPLSK